MRGVSSPLESEPSEAGFLAFKTIDLKDEAEHPESQTVERYEGGLGARKLRLGRC